MSHAPLLIVDAFTNRPFAGNPAAVCLLPAGAPEPAAEWMQSLAGEMNLSETAFVRPLGGARFGLRWFTPRVEVDLCGHATLASAHTLFTTGVLAADAAISFETRSGTLVCSRTADGWIRMDFPADPVRTMVMPERIDDILGTAPLYAGRGKSFLLLEVGSEEELRGLRPDFGALARMPFPLVIATCEGSAPYHFLSRCFGPAVGIPEDPVTGSAHCTLVPYWAKRLKRTSFLAHQASRRGGDLRLELAGDRVILEGQAVTVVDGRIATP